MISIEFDPCYFQGPFLRSRNQGSEDIGNEDLYEDVYERNIRSKYPRRRKRFIFWYFHGSVDQIWLKSHNSNEIIIRRRRQRQRIKSDLHNQNHRIVQDITSIDKFFNHPNRNKRYRRRKKNGIIPFQLPFIPLRSRKYNRKNECYKENYQKNYFDFIPSVHFMKTILCSFWLEFKKTTNNKVFDSCLLLIPKTDKRWDSLMYTWWP